MARSTSAHRFLACGLLILSAAASGALTPEDAAAREIAPATLVLRLPTSLGTEQRPAVEFNHAAHTKALKAEGCASCHTLTDAGLTPTLAAATGLEDRDAVVDAYHDACIGCHRQRSEEGVPAGPLTCGRCHVKRKPGVSQRLAMSFDYSLHARHSKAYEDKCETCHHVYDKAQEKLVYVKGQEDACAACHRAVDQGKLLSRANASHRSCVSCHLQRTSNGQEAGPVLCVGCHDPQQRQQIKQLEEVPRLMRGQADQLWVATTQTQSPAVAFDHLAHEHHTTSCSQCHHEGLPACGSCHTLQGSPEGAGVTLEESFHTTPSSLSCVGCHRQEAIRTQCAGCHASIAARTTERACAVCHRGPRAASMSEDLAPPAPMNVVLDPLPVSSESFPEKVTIDVLVQAYEASQLPHGKIVAKLDEAIRDSSLARSFHGSTEAMCAGCHHHAPIGARPPQCRACHGSSAQPTHDQPSLKVAYHRQCIGCHQRMGIAKQGCTDCHAKKEVHS